MRSHRTWIRRAAALALPLVMSCVLTPVLAAENDATIDPNAFKSLEYRNIGPFRGGRVTAVTGVPGERGTFYMGSTGGGVWKTTDGGLTWKNVSDESFKSASVGALAVARSDTNVVYAGTGSACVRGNISPGDGVYRSTDAGKTWKNVGLKSAGQIGRIRVHPTNPDLVYVAALGHAFGPSEQRGVFRSKDGGATWEKVLYVGDKAGAVDLAMDPGNPRVLYAAIWRVERKPWTLISGGEGSGLHKSTDGGDTWKELTEGLPKGVKGRIGVSVSGADSNRVWALVEAEDGGLFRSDDAGGKFRLVNADRNFRQRAWYYTHIFADPRDVSTVYVLNTSVWRSNDAGKEFELIRTPHGDNHDLWIDPDDTRVMIEGNDGGANVTVNGGRTWTEQSNQPTGEMYRVTVDRQFPYRVYGCQQDNTCVSIPSRTTSSGIARQDWYVIGGCESGHVAVDPRNPEISYAGCYGGQIGRYDHATHLERSIMVYPQLAVGQAPKDLKYRFQWQAPIRISPHDPSVLYQTSQFVHRSTDEGQSWTVISPDLTRNDKSKQGYAGEPITRDNTGVEVYGTIFAFEESPLQAGLLWAGTDDGRVHISRDAGKSWQEITPKGMPEDGQVNMIELSAHGAGRAFIAVTRYRFDDFTPYIYRTDDYGKGWTRIADGKRGIPADHFVRVVREDPVRKGLLYAGTEFGMYISFDDGEHWQSFQQKLPVTPITDLAITNGDLVVATQGRAFWILDDLSPLREMTREVAGAELHLFKPRDTYRLGGGGGFGGGSGASGQNPPGGVIIEYTLGRKLEEKEELVLEILDANGAVLRTLSSTKDEPQAPNIFRKFFPDTGPSRKLPAESGMNRYVWNFRLPDASLVDDAVLWGVARGPLVPPGKYAARLKLGDKVFTQEFAVKADPRWSASQEDLAAVFDLSKRIWSSLSESHAIIERLRDVREQAKGIAKRLDEAGKGEGIDAAAKALTDKLDALEASIHQVKAESSQDILNFTPMLDNQFLDLLGNVDGADTRPTAGATERFMELRLELDGDQKEMKRIESEELKSFTDLVRAKGAEPVILPAR